MEDAAKKLVGDIDLFGEMDGVAKLNDLLGGDQLKFLCNVVRKHESAGTLMYTINVIKCMCMQLDCISAKKSS